MMTEDFFSSAISNKCPTFLLGHSSKSKRITVMKVNKWNEIKQGHTSLEGQQMPTEMEVIFSPLVSQQKRGKRASCHFAQSTADHINKNIGLARNFVWQKTVTQFNVKGQFFCVKALSALNSSQGKHALNNPNLIQSDFFSSARTS